MENCPFIHDLWWSTYWKWWCSIATSNHQRAYQHRFQKMELSWSLIYIYICVFKLFLIKFWDRNFKKPLVCKDWSRPKNTKVTWDYPGETRGNLRFFSAHGKAMAILAMLGWLWHMISSDPPKLIWFSSPIFLTVCLLECSAISSSSTAKKTFPSSYQAGGMCSSCTHASP